MVAGAFAGWMAVYSGTGLWIGVCVAMLVGMLFGLVHSTLTVPFGLSQHVVGLGVTLLATSSTYYAYRLALPEVTSPPKIEAFQPYEIPILSGHPITWTGVVFANTTHVSRLHSCWGRWRGPLSHTAWTRRTRSWRKPRGSGCSRPIRHCNPHGGRYGWQRPDGSRRSFLDDVGIRQFLL